MKSREKDLGGGWKAQEFLLTKEGDRIGRQNKYFYKNKVAQRIPLTSKLAENLAGYALIEKDLRSVLIWLGEINKMFPKVEQGVGNAISPDRERFDIIKGLFTASLIFYGKCFSSCEGRRTKLNRKLLDKKYHDTHSEIILMRHNFAAHSGADKFEEVMIALVLPPKKKQNLPPIIFRELTQADMLFDDEGEISFESLVKHVQKIVLGKMKVVEDKIIKEEVLIKGKDYWYRKAKKVKEPKVEIDNQ